jgi:hypothetical protein
MTKKAHSTIATGGLIVMKQRTSIIVEKDILLNQAERASFIVDDSSLLSKNCVNSSAETGLPSKYP